MEVRSRQVEDNARRRVDALKEEAAWAECAAFEGFKAEMAGVGEARKRADDKHRTERLLDEQVCHSLANYARRTGKKMLCLSWASTNHEPGSAVSVLEAISPTST
jgi:hypothetical protein